MTNDQSLRDRALADMKINYENIVKEGPEGLMDYSKTLALEAFSSVQKNASFIAFTLGALLATLIILGMSNGN